MIFTTGSTKRPLVQQTSATRHQTKPKWENGGDQQADEVKTQVVFLTMRETAKPKKNNDLS